MTAIVWGDPISRIFPHIAGQSSSKLFQATRVSVDRGSRCLFVSQKTALSNRCGGAKLTQAEEMRLLCSGIPNLPERPAISIATGRSYQGLGGPQVAVRQDEMGK